MNRLAQAPHPTAAPAATGDVTRRDEAREERRLLAAVAAALLGAQGSPVWSRTAERLVLSSPDVRWQHQRAAEEVDAILRDEMGEG